MNPKSKSIGHHGPILQLLISLLLFLGHASAQATHGGSDMYGFDPNMAILIMVLVTVSCALGFFFVYIRRCFKRDNVHSADAGNRLSLSRPQPRGLDASVMDTFPTFRYSTAKTHRIGSKEVFECPVCLNEFEDDETLRLIPKCCHVFHHGCIDAWLRSHSTCPLCRANLVPVPGEAVVSIQIPGLVDDPPGSGLIRNQSMPRRSMSTIQHAENLDRFTLRLPQDIHNKLVNPPRLSKDHVAFPQVMSSARGYRTGSLETDINYFYYEWFDQDGRLDRRPFSITDPS